MTIKETGRQVYLATLGAAGAAVEGGKTVAGQAIDKARAMTPAMAVPDVPAIVKGARKPVKKAIADIEDVVEQVTRSVLARLGMPTRAEVTTLTRRVERLIEKVDTMHPPRRVARRAKVTKATNVAKAGARSPKPAARGGRRDR